MHQVGIFIDKCLSHAAGMFSVNAKNNRFLESVTAFLQELGDFLCNQSSSIIQYQGAVKVPGVVNAVFDLIAVPV